ncbi:MAG: ECF transporter S component [Candidatus Cloacimonadaceae bacterium]|nr:ECF transporter S component [Candidatus Cloacimonadaceae bacterium]
MKWYFLVGLTVMVTVGTLLFRIPIPGGGYFNFGDVVVVFAGLYAGKKVGMIAGGVGSAIADLIGFPIFAPITLIAKGLEGLLCGFGHGKKALYTFLFPAIGVSVMVVVYFFGTWLLPQSGLAGAIAELVPNMLQALFGFAGGRMLYAAFKHFE